MSRSRNRRSPSQTLQYERCEPRAMLNDLATGSARGEPYAIVLQLLV